MTLEHTTSLSNPPASTSAAPEGSAVSASLPPLSSSHEPISAIFTPQANDKAAQGLPFTEAVEQVRRQLDIVEVVSRHVALKRSGKHHVGLCPFHPDKKPSMTVSREKNIYKCFSCGAGGDAFGFIMAIENRTFGQVVTELAEQQGITIARSANPQVVAQQQQAAVEAKEDRQRLWSLHDRTCRWYQAQLATPQGAFVKEYLEKRNLSDAIRQQFRIGYAPPGWETLVSAVTQSGEIPVSDLVLGGLVSQKEGSTKAYDRFRNRLMVPIADDQGRVIAFGGRALSFNGAPEEDPKYLNSPETPIYHKSRVLFGLDVAKTALRQKATAVIMEGYFDVMAAHQAGVTHAVGVCGTALTEDHARLLTRCGVEHVVLCFDGDLAGIRATLSSLELMDTFNRTLANPLRVSVLQIPVEGDVAPKDPADYLQAVGAHAFCEWVQTAPVPALRFRVEQALVEASQKMGSLATVEGRSAAVEAIAPLLATIQQPVQYREWLQHYARRLQVHPMDLEVSCNAHKKPVLARKPNKAGFSSRWTTQPSYGVKHPNTPVQKMDSAFQAISHIEGSLTSNQTEPTPTKVAPTTSRRFIASLTEQRQRLEQAILLWGLMTPTTCQELMTLLPSLTFEDAAAKQLADCLHHGSTVVATAAHPLEALADVLMQQRSQEGLSAEHAEQWQQVSSLHATLALQADEHLAHNELLGWDKAKQSKEALQQLNRMVAAHRTLSRQGQLATLTESVRHLKAEDECGLLEAQYAFRSTLLDQGRASLPSSQAAPLGVTEC
ncbi:MAG: DNA primase [Vampirovibrionales bacterium]|nr:DNA primase [Vampirovibrionales bacterium]